MPLGVATGTHGDGNAGNQDDDDATQPQVTLGAGEGIAQLGPVFMNVHQLLTGMQTRLEPTLECQDRYRLARK